MVVVCYIHLCIKRESICYIILDDEAVPDDDVLSGTIQLDPAEEDYPLPGHDRHPQSDPQLGDSDSAIYVSRFPAAKIQPILCLGPRHIIRADLHVECRDVVLHFIF